MNLKSSCLGFLGAEITDVSHHTQLSRDTLANTETRNNPQSEGSFAKKKKKITNTMEENLKQKKTKSQETQLLCGTNMRGVIRGQK